MINIFTHARLVLTLQNPLSFSVRRKNHTSALSARNRFLLPEISKVTCMCTMGCGPSGATSAAADSASPPISRITCCCTSADAPIKSSSSPCQTCDFAQRIIKRFSLFFAHLYHCTVHIIPCHSQRKNILK